MKRFFRLLASGGLLLALGAIGCRSAEYFPAMNPSPPRDVAEHLMELREPPLWDATPCPQCERYRFLWIRSAHRSAVFRVEVNAHDQGAMIVTLGPTDARESAARGVKTYRRTLLAAEVKAVRAAVKDAAFWALGAEPDEGRTDGAHWEFEAQTTEGYHLVNRWSPEPGAYRQLCLLLIRLSGLELQPVY